LFTKDVIGPNGSVSMINLNDDKDISSDNIKSHVEVAGLKIHNSELDRNGHFKIDDKLIKLPCELEHDVLCKREQECLLNTISKNIDMSSHWDDVINSQRIVMAADESIRTGSTVTF
jgi:hypothetical protein